MGVSRISKAPIPVPKGTEVQVLGQEIIVSGKLGKSRHAFPSLVHAKLIDNVLQITAADNSTEANMLAGTVRAITHNSVVGVTTGFERKLVLVGVGYRAKVEAGGKKLNLSVGFSHPVDIVLPEGVTADMPTPTEITLKGPDKQKVSQTAANIRSVRPPEAYKGKGIRYADEKIVLKEVKKK